MAEQSRRVRFDGTVTLGNLLTAGVVAAGLIIWGVRLEGRVDGQDIVIAKDQAAVAEKIGSVEKSMGERIGTLKDQMEMRTAFMQEALSRIEGGLRRVEEKLDRKADKP